MLLTLCAFSSSKREHIISLLIIHTVFAGLLAGVAVYHVAHHYRKKRLSASFAFPSFYLFSQKTPRKMKGKSALPGHIPRLIFHSNYDYTTCTTQLQPFAWPQDGGQG